MSTNEQKALIHSDIRRRFDLLGASADEQVSVLQEWGETSVDNLPLSVARAILTKLLLRSPSDQREIATMGEKVKIYSNRITELERTVQYAAGVIAELRSELAEKALRENCISSESEE